MPSHPLRLPKVRCGNSSQCRKLHRRVVPWGSLEASPLFGRRVPKRSPGPVAPSKRLLLSSSVSTPQQGWQRTSDAELRIWGLGGDQNHGVMTAGNSIKVKTSEMREQANHKHQLLCSAQCPNTIYPNASSANNCLSQRRKCPS